MRKYIFSGFLILSSILTSAEAQETSESATASGRCPSPISQVGERGYLLSTSVDDVVFCYGEYQNFLKINDDALRLGQLYHIPDAAIQEGNLERIRELAVGGFPFDEVYDAASIVTTHPLVKAIMDRDADLAFAVLEADLNLNRRHGGNTLVAKAIESHLDDVARELIARGADVGPNDSGWTLLHVAARYSNSNMIPDLVSMGYNVNAQARDGTVPAHWAVVATNQTLRAIMELDPDMTVADVSGLTPVNYLAVKHSFLSRSDYLLRKHFIPNIELLHVRGVDFSPLTVTERAELLSVLPESGARAIIVQLE